MRYASTKQCNSHALHLTSPYFFSSAIVEIVHLMLQLFAGFLISFGFLFSAFVLFRCFCSPFFPVHLNPRNGDFLVAFVVLFVYLPFASSSSAISHYNWFVPFFVSVACSCDGYIGRVKRAFPLLLLLLLFVLRFVGWIVRGLYFLLSPTIAIVHYFTPVLMRSHR